MSDDKDQRLMDIIVGTANYQSGACSNCLPHRVPAEYWTATTVTDPVILAELEGSIIREVTPPAPYTDLDPFCEAHTAERRAQSRPGYQVVRVWRFR